MKKFLFIVFLFSLHSIFAFAEKKSFWLSGLLTSPDHEITAEVDWDENNFTGSAYTYNHAISRIAAIMSACSYSHTEWPVEKSAFLKNLDILGFPEAGRFFHFQPDYSDERWGYDQCGYMIAKKEMSDGENLVFVIVRGTPFSFPEWISNFNVANSTKSVEPIHEGFAKSARAILEGIDEYLSKNNLDPKKAKILVTGHSRGASVANVLAALMCDSGKFERQNLFAYTFASQNVTRQKDAHEEKYFCIWNVQNGEDISTNMPMDGGKWGFTKFGREKTIISAWNSNHALFLNIYYPNANSYFKRLTGRDMDILYSGYFYSPQVNEFALRFNESVDSYYTAIDGFYPVAEKLAKKILPKDENHQPYLPKFLKDTEEMTSGILNKLTGGKFYRVMHYFFDMHCPEGYESWLLTLDEDCAFSEDGWSQVVVKSRADTSVVTLDDDGFYRKIASSENGRTLWPVFENASPTWQSRMGTVIFGISQSRQVDLIFEKNSIFPTKVSAHIERYTVDGHLISSSPEVKFYLRGGKAFVNYAGNDTFWGDSLDVLELNEYAADGLFDRYNLRQERDFHIDPEYSVNCRGISSIGLHLGLEIFYASVLADSGYLKYHDFASFSAGIGSGRYLFSNIMFDSELLCRFTWLCDDRYSDDFGIVPFARLSLSVRPFRRLRFFVAGTFDLKIPDFNESAFEASSYRPGFCSWPILSSDYEIAPQIQLGVRF